MIEDQIPETTLINSIIGQGTRFTGEFNLNGLLRVDGDFSGTIKTKGKVLIGSNGRVECTMHAGTVVIGGIVKGDIFSSEKVIILSTGIMIGNITSPRLIIEEGVQFNGQCRIVRSKKKVEQKADTQVKDTIGNDSSNHTVDNAVTIPN
ncbi:MAG: polymer-forming cytoskeletal protein [Spirochaetales bacterium]|nr:polymer-forming cytoskeletal protein [Spirochaetales bacterium]